MVIFTPFCSHKQIKKPARRVEIRDDIYRIMDGDEGALTRFMTRHSSRLYYLAYGILHQRERAEEVVSDVFFEVWRLRGELDRIRNVEGWLATVTYRKAISALRRGEGRESLSVDEVGEFLLEPTAAPDEGIIGREELAALDEAVRELPPRCREVFFLAKFEHLPYKQISELLGISVKTINNHIAYALEKIAGRLKVGQR